MLPPIDVSTEKPAPRIGAELQRLIGLMQKVAWACQYCGIISIIFYVSQLIPNFSLLVSGMASVCMSALVRMKISFIHGSKSWVEISVTTACGLYLPCFTLLVNYLGRVDIHLSHR